MSNELVSWLALVFALAFLAEAVAHFLPWSAWLRTRHIIANYVIGCLILTAAFAVWALATGNWQALVVWLATLTGGGAGVLAMYRVDHGNNLDAELNRLRAENDRLKEFIERMRYAAATKEDC